MKRIGLLVTVVLAAALLPGCMGTMLYETARTTPPGKAQFGGSLTPVHIVATGDGIGGTFIPLPDLFVKLGVAPGFDLGARWAFGPGITVNGKAQFMRGKVDGAFHLAGNFTGIFVGGGGFGAATLAPRVILSSEPPGGFPFAANAGLSYTGVFAGGDGETASGGTLGAVAGFGLPFRLGAKKTLVLQPEVGVGIPILAGASYSGETEFIEALNALSINAGINFGYAPTR